MDPRQFFTASRIIMVAGKGGVGKTTVAAALGVCAAAHGIDTLLVEIEGKRGLATLFGHDALAYDAVELQAPVPELGQGRLRARTISADAALADYFEDHGLRRFGRTLGRMQVLDTLATSTPGLRDLIVLGKVKALEVADDAELIIVDAPASGHALSFLRAARGLQQSVDTGPIRRQADEVAEMLNDPARAQVVLVAAPEETPVNELIETAYALEEDVGVALAPLLVNGLLPERDVSTSPSRSPNVDPDLADAAAAACRHWITRAGDQAAQVEKLAAELPLDQFTLDRRFTTHLDRSDLDAMATSIAHQIGEMQLDVAEVS